MQKTKMSAFTPNARKYGLEKIRIWGTIYAKVIKGRRYSRADWVRINCDLFKVADIGG